MNPFRITQGIRPKHIVVAAAVLALAAALYLFVAVAWKRLGADGLSFLAGLILMVGAAHVWSWKNPPPGR